MNLKRQKRKLQEEKCELEKTLLDLEINANDSTIDSLISKAKALPKAIHEGLLKRTRFEEQNNNNDKAIYYPGQYSREIRDFAISLHNTSAAAYRYVRYLVISISCQSLNHSFIILNSIIKFCTISQLVTHSFTHYSVFFLICTDHFGS